MRTIITFIIIFSILVIIHEFGHFYFAKRAGILVREFAIGMGPKIFSYRKNNTTYTVRLLPLGGYVRMAGYGDDETELKAGMPLSVVLDEKGDVTHINLSEKPLIDAVPLELTHFDLDRDMVIEGVVPGQEQASRYSVKRDALIIETDGTEVQVAPIDVQFQSASLFNRMLTNFAGPMNNFILGIIVFSSLAFMQGGVAVNRSQVGDVVANSPAQEAGLQANDVITAINGQEVSTWSEMTALIQENPGKDMELLIERNEEEQHIQLISDPETGLIGIQQSIDRSFGAKIMYGFSQTWFVISSIFSLILSMFTKGFDINAFGGPVAIYAATEEVVSYGFYSILSFLGFLSVNLGTVNLLPIPALDGGKILLNIIEGVRGKPLEPEKEGIITVIGVGLLFILMILITWNDIQRFFFGG
ncbi:MAG TPA: RIP metalloprotease RseP [Candidatus Jeotgalibaca merdavium]|uniref:Zinc metalloprotease n=1 Tax=Candidatus Jeotgalibaca merdavium TaxID=2838627 RepID=A0A9D2I103_9LACT|nr:RIP metalloprotease RseP [Candidatus Jeotgalibaca merdavium]